MIKVFCNLCSRPIDDSIVEITRHFSKDGVRMTVRFEPLPRVADFDICKACKISLLKEELSQLEGF